MMYFKLCICSRALVVVLHGHMITIFGPCILRVDRLSMSTRLRVNAQARWGRKWGSYDISTFRS